MLAPSALCVRLCAHVLWSSTNGRSMPPHATTRRIFRGDSWCFAVVPVVAGGQPQPSVAWWASYASHVVCLGMAPPLLRLYLCICVCV